MTTIGAHNTLDGAAPATAFADLIFFTEAIPDKVRAELEPHGYEVAHCRQQRDLVIAWKRGLFTPRSSHWRLAHPGIAKVTPHRGTFWIVGKLDGRKVVLVNEHRINAAFPPYRRGEATFRRVSWRWHTRLTLRRIRHWKRRGLLVIAGGDLNTPHGVDGYRGILHEVGTHYDRLGSTERLREVQILSRMGSDHPRLRARLG